MKRFFKILAYSFGIILLLISILGLLAYIYEDDIEKYLVNAINEKIETQINVEKTNFSFIKKFPHASFSFIGVEVLEATYNQEKNTLLSAENIFIKLNLIDIITGNYTIEEIEIEAGILNIAIDKKGKDNYHIWKQSTDSSETNINVDLEAVSVSEITLYYTNHFDQSYLATDIEELSLSGSFSDKIYDLETAFNIYIHEYKNKEDRLIADQNLSINAVLLVNNEENKYLINKAKASLSGLNLNLSGNIINSEEKTELDIQVSGDELNINSLLELFPEKIMEKYEDIKSDGELTINGAIKGVLSHTSSPNIDVNFEIKNGSIERNDVVLNNLYFNGNYTNGNKNALKTSKLIIHQFNVKIEDGTFEGKGSLTDFEKPSFNLDLKGNFNLNYIYKLLEPDSIEFIEGNTLFNIHFENNFPSFSEINANTFKTSIINGEVMVTDGRIKYTNSPYPIDSIGFSMVSNNRNLEIKQFKAKYNLTDISVNGNAQYIFSYLLFDNVVPNIQLSLSSNYFDLQNFLSETSSSTSDLKFNIPDSLILSVKANIKELRFGKFLSQDIKANLKLKDAVITADNIYLKSQKGEISGDIVIEQTEDELLMSSNCKLTNIDVQQLFYEFNNFSQTEILDKNIKGKGFVDATVVCVLDHHLNINLNKLYVNADVLIENGQLIDYQTLSSLSKYIELDDLMNIKFSKLSNNIQVKNRKVYIPDMEIKSSALDLSLSGIHSFNNEIDYHFNLLMRDILGKKAKQAKKENEEFAVEEPTGGTRLFLRMYGTVDDYKVTYDRKAVREKWQDDMQKEKQTLKGILKEEFNLYKNDTSVTSPSNNTNEKPVQLDLGDDEEKKSTTKEEEKKKKEPKTKLGKFFEKITEENDEEFEK